MDSKISGLPILKHFESDQITESVNSFRKGEKGLFFFVKLFALIAVGYFSWVYVLPTVFKMIGQTLAIIGSLGIIVATIFMLPVIFKILRRVTRLMHKLVIKHDPFGELEEQRVKMQENKTIFLKNTGKIVSLRNDMEIEADLAEKNAKALETKIIALDEKAGKLKKSNEQLIVEEGVSAKGTDKYINDLVEYQKTLSEAQRRGYELNQQKDFVGKFGSRGNIMKKLAQKLVLVGASMDIKLLDLDATINILKKDFEFAEKARQATDAVKDTLMFDQKWEVEYALDVVTSTIAQDNAITFSNLKDIDSLTTNFSMDSDELFTNLSTLADGIRVGKDPIPSAKEYTSPDYQLTHNDKLKSGGFQDIF